MTNHYKIGVICTLYTLLAATTSFAQTTDANLYTPHNKLSGAAAVAASANYGAGIKFAVVDTGLAPSVWFTPSFNKLSFNNINTANSGVCLNGTCTRANPLTTPTDRQGHGTFVASQIVGGAPGFGYDSVARAGTVMSVRVFGDNGSGSSLDTANGIRFAADNGANVVNLSLGPAGGNAAQQAAFYQSLASAVNYAASKNTYVVFAAGNANQAFANGGTITGFSDAAIQRMIIVGSTNDKMQKSSFSNTAGSNAFVSTSGKRYNVSSLFVSAVGENIAGASNSNAGTCAGYACLARMSGTSMAAPQVTGAVGLLESKWAILKTNGLATKVLQATARDLGSAGIDNTFGNGFMDLVKAFQPHGGLYVWSVGNKYIDVKTVKASTITSGALGNLSSILPTLANFTAFDVFQRNFSVNFSGLVSAKPATSAATQTVTAPKTTTSGAKFANGSTLAFGQMHYADDVLQINNSLEGDQNKNMFVAYADTQGRYVATGHGFPSAASFANSLWGNNSQAAQQSSQLGMAGSVLGFAGGGYFSNYGAPLNSKTRVAFGYTQSAETTASSAKTAAQAVGYNVGLSRQLTKNWQLGGSVGLLSEENGLLGTNYADSPLAFGTQHQSHVLNVASSLALTDNTSLLFDASYAKTNGAAVQNSLISHVSDVYSRSFGASLASRNVVKAKDTAVLSLRAPLRVIAGSATLVSNDIDTDGNPIVSYADYSLKPNGQELSIALDYNTPIIYKDQDNVMSWGVMLQARQDAGNVQGANDVSGLVNFKVAF
jgi:hypothetical protein